MKQIFLEDFVVGQVFTTKQHQVTAEQIIEFAQQFDPQPFHTNKEQAQSSFLRG
ncbi:MaoC/PaaZ C-terminal domain-containing protein [Thalassotalea euphylliae]|uniref:MaoC/PaaZ C-terminal domain-containing protein n=1 Tax=Thalassotalea euphylliae TaxID=1655234 RepID=UPI0015F298D7|nr:MaoC/PaaZ C-terminal domain-containing protein [Thalassotalea euphylliae]